MRLLSPRVRKENTLNPKSHPSLSSRVAGTMDDYGKAHTTRESHRDNGREVVATASLVSNQIISKPHGVDAHREIDAVILWAKSRRAASLVVIRRPYLRTVYLYFSSSRHRDLKRPSALTHILTRMMGDQKTVDSVWPLRWGAPHSTGRGIWRTLIRAIPGVEPCVPKFARRYPKTSEREKENLH